MHRRALVLAGVLGIGAYGTARAASGSTAIKLWKAPTCGCCNDWIRHLESNGFKVRAHDTSNTPALARLGIPMRLGSCHTAQADGYAIEGHVPAREIRRLLAERPRAVGLAVPGMPIGSPGMDGPAYGSRTEPYDVLLVRKDRSTAVYQTYRRS